MVQHEDAVSLVPASLDLTVAGTIPAVALTSFFSLKELGAPWTKKNTTVVITSGSGGTGFIGIQMAKLWGAAHIVTACSPQHMDFVKSLGADIVVDYHKHDIFDFLQNDSVDFVYDNYGKDGTADKASHAIRAGGTYLMMPHAECFVYATLGLPQAQKPPCTARYPKDGVTYENFNTLPQFAKGGQAALDEVRGWFDAGKLIAHVDKTFTRNEIRAAYNYSSSGHIVGKIAVVPAPPTDSDKCAMALECTGTSDRASIVPVGGGPVAKFPCYEGSPEDLYNACKWDILRRPLRKNVRCGTCAEVGYGKHISQDPVFKKVNLWAKNDDVIV
jgi:NADPH:quinone reductase-like Zn-dependent oxidoreductase